MKQYLKKFMYIITKKRIDESKLDVLDINANSYDLRYFNLSSNSIISLDYNGDTYYFRECPKICKLSEYLSVVIDNFFFSLNKKTISKEHFSQKLPIRITFDDNEIVEFRNYLAQKSTCKDYFKLLTSADKISEAIGFSVWENTDFSDGFFRSFGFSDIPDYLKDIAVYFLWVLRGAMYNFRTMKYIRGKKYSFFSASKAIASKILADELMVGSLITETLWCRITLEDNRILFGVMTKAAKGSRMSDTEPELSGKLQRELNILNLLDIICFQKDHGPNNYNVTEEGEVCAFDNDNPTTFMPIATISASLSGCSPYVNNSGKVLRPYVDKTFLKLINNIDTKALTSKLKPYLNVIQISALKKRILKLCKAINNSVSCGELKLLDIDEWTTKTAEEELSLKNINTYLKIAIK
ncbi:MAG: hypothetical protein E7532_03075 [Ruminococcaceae bacterium]|nr:hypothetical protein [Oscillospiraceae bacterium]